MCISFRASFSFPWSVSMDWGLNILLVLCPKAVLNISDSSNYVDVFLSHLPSKFLYHNFYIFYFLHWMISPSVANKYPCPCPIALPLCPLRRWLCKAAHGNSVRSYWHSQSNQSAALGIWSLKGMILHFQLTAWRCQTGTIELSDLLWPY